MSVNLQTPEGFSCARGVQYGGAPAEGMLAEDPNLPAGSRKHAGAAEATSAQQEGADDAPAEQLREDAGQCGQRAVDVSVTQTEEHLPSAASPPVKHQILNLSSAHLPILSAGSYVAGRLETL